MNNDLRPTEASDVTLANNREIISIENNLTKKDFKKTFWRSFALLSSFNYERMQGLGYLYSIMPQLKKIYKDDPEGLKKAYHRHMEAFNMTIAPAPFVMGITVAMEEKAKADPNFDTASINAVKVALMGPLSGIGDTFFWGIFRIIACSIGISFAANGNFLAPFIMLILFNVPAFLTRWYGLKIGYSKGSQLLTDLQESGKIRLFTYCAGIVGVMAIGCMVASQINIVSPIDFSISGQKIVIQDYLNQILPKLLPLVTTLAILVAIKKRIKVTRIIGTIVIVGFILGVLGIIG
jgi:mannose/fructose/N-acetylgalactosamine-specific phosphotransferase system component IID